MNLFTKQKQTHRHGKQMVIKGERVGRVINWKYGINRWTVLYTKQISKKDLMSSTGDYIEYLVIIYNTDFSLKRIKIKIYTYICITQLLSCIPETNTIL